MKKCRIKNLNTNMYISHIIKDINDPYYNIVFLAYKIRFIYSNKERAIIFKSYKEAEKIIHDYARKGRYLLEDI